MEMSTENDTLRLVPPTVTSMLPEGHFQYTSAPTTTVVRPDRGIHVPAVVVSTFRGMTTAARITFAAIFFLVCLAIPTYAATTAFNFASTSAPVETVRTQQVPSSGLVEEPKPGVAVQVADFLED